MFEIYPEKMIAVVIDLLYFQMAVVALALIFLLVGCSKWAGEITSI